MFTLDKLTNSNNFFLLAGPCVIEGEDMALRIAEKITEITTRLQIPYVFKGSYRKANRSRLDSFTGIGDEKALKILRKVGETFGVPTVTDIHETHEAAMAAEYVDVLQIPAFLCRQTDLLVAAARTGGVQEIVVTAQKRAENLQNVPVAVTAVTSEAIANARIENIADLRSIAPNLYVVTQPGGSSIPSTVMRGQVSGAASNPTVDNGISYYIDGVYLGALNGILFDINEIERIEIIRGPAGTLFGTNSTGGAINYITSGPKGEFGIKQDFSYARFGSFRSKTRIDTPEWNGLSAKRCSTLHMKR